MISSTLDDDINQIKQIVQEKIISSYYIKKINKRKYYYYYYFSDYNTHRVNVTNRRCLYWNDLGDRICSKSRSILSCDYYVEKEENLTDFYKKTLFTMRSEYISNIRHFHEKSSCILMNSNNKFYNNKENNSRRNSGYKSVETIHTKNVNNQSVKYISNSNPIDTNTTSIYLSKSSN